MYKINDFLKSKGYNTDDIDYMKPYIVECESWYKNKVRSFQNYYVFNGEKKVNCKRYTLGMAKKVCEDYANLLLNEKVDFRVGNEAENKVFNDLLNENDFYQLANSGIERSFATGTGAFVLGIKDVIYDEDKDTYSFEDARLKIEFVSALKIYPLSYSNQKIEECGFGVEKVINGKKILCFTIHKKNDLGNYVIENYLFEITRGDNLVNITDKLQDAFVEFDTRSPYPWFSIIRPGIENNIAEDSPFGIPIIANSIDILKGIDICYDSFVNEFTLGKKRIAVKKELLKPDMITGNLKLSFDPNDVVFYYLDVDDDGKSMIQAIDMDLRVNDHASGIQFGLNLLSSKCTLGNFFYKFENGNVTTATQVISENSDLFRNIHKHEIRIDNCLHDLFKSICYIAREFLKMPLSEESEISIDFDDSIFEDRKEIKNTAMLELNNGLLSPTLYYMKVYGMTEKQASEYYKQVQEGIVKKPEEKEVDEE